MKFLRFLGWLFIPFIMIFIRWYDISKTARIVFSIWAIILLLTAFENRPQLNQTKAASAQVVQIKEKAKTTKTTPKASLKSNASITQATPATTQPTQPVLTPMQKLQKEYNQYHSDEKLGKSTQKEFEQLFKDEIDIDKSDFLKTTPNLEDIGYASDLAVSTLKGTFTGGSYIVNQSVPTTPDGIYWYFPITIDDIGSGPISIDPKMFQLVAKDGTTYDNDLNAELSLTGVSPITIEQINPMIDTQRYLVFDMPTDVNLSDVMLKISYGFQSTEINLPTPATNK